ncbi:MAG TPA: hypothetical protein ENF94_01530 [Candidatus Woesearchaeota archaeon]|nr:MAG: hypothetical protein DRJ25_02815 [Candidatus Woesearchaeota archaeon]HDD70822.1 hypothetical protein [Candidatus Woesearchaeota archaeon]
MDEKINEIILALQEVEEDNSVPRNVKEKIIITKQILNEETDISIKVSRALQSLEELTDDTNMEAFTRSQIFNIVSMLEFLS